MTENKSQASGVPEPTPITTSQRHRSLDVLRGFALLGILGPNILAFAWPEYAQHNPVWMGRALEMVDPSLEPHAANSASLTIVSIFFYGKMMFLFSLLFGAGVVMYAKKFEGGRLRSGWWLWYRRMGWLMLIGLVHAVVLWYGDILVAYSLAGLASLWWVRRFSPRVLALVGSLAICWGTGVYTLAMVLWAVQAGQSEEAVLALTQSIADEIEAYTGTYSSAFGHRMGMLAQIYGLILPIGIFWMSSGIMLIGMSLTKLGVLTGERSTRFYALLAGIGLPLGLGFSAGVYFLCHQFGQEAGWMLFLGMGQAVGIPTAFGYMGLVILLVRLDVLKGVSAALSAVGRMALSNYLLHTLLGTLVFYAHGLGMYGRVQFPELWYLMAGMWAINILFSVVWLRFFRFGPAEWLWRSLTYWKPQPMRRVSTVCDT